MFRSTEKRRPQRREGHRAEGTEANDEDVHGVKPTNKKTDKKSKEERKEAKVDPDVVPLLAETAEVADSRYREGRKKFNRKHGLGSDDDELEDDVQPNEWMENPAQREVRLLIGRDVFNSDTAHRQYEKRLSHAKTAAGCVINGMSVDEVTMMGQRQLEATGEMSSYVDRAQPSGAAIDRLVEQVTAQAKRGAEFSRRRRFNESEDVSYINERNRKFNKKVNQAFDPYTLEIAQNLERGTAL